MLYSHNPILCQKLIVYRQWEQSLACMYTKVLTEHLFGSFPILMEKFDSASLVIFASIENIRYLELRCNAFPISKLDHLFWVYHLVPITFQHPDLGTLQIRCPSF